MHLHLESVLKILIKEEEKNIKKTKVPTSPSEQSNYILHAVPKWGRKGPGPAHNIESHHTDGFNSCDRIKVSSKNKEYNYTSTESLIFSDH